MKRILFVTYDFPYPLTSGGKSRSYHLLKFSKSKQQEVFLFSFIRKHPKEEELNEIKKIGVKEIFLQKRKRAEKKKLFLRSLFSKHSVFKYLYYDRESFLKILQICDEKSITTIQFESFYTAYFMSPEFSKLGIKQIYGSENIEHLLYEDLARFSKNLLLKIAYSFQAKKIKREEIKFYKESDETLTVTSQEQKIALQHGSKNVSVIPNGIDLDFFKYKNSKAKKIEKLLFVGNFSYFPNVYAVQYVFSEIFQKLPPYVTITIIGKGQENISSIPKNNKRVKIIEYIHDIRDAYYASDAFLFPVRIGGGTNFKVLEAVACGLPIIAFPEKVENLGFEKKKNFISCEDSRDFVENIVNVDLDSEDIHRMTRASRKLVEMNYSWENIGRKQQKVWK